MAELGTIAVAQRAGRIVRLEDVAEVSDSQADASSVATYDGRPVVVVAARKQSGTNMVKVVDALRAYEHCVAASKGKEKCAAEMQQLDDAHDDLEDAIDDYKQACP